MEIIDKDKGPRKLDIEESENLFESLVKFKEDGGTLTFDEMITSYNFIIKLELKYIHKIMELFDIDIHNPRISESKIEETFLLRLFFENDLIKLKWLFKINGYTMEEVIDILYRGMDYRDTYICKITT
jgi:hypothetical protein